MASVKEFFEPRVKEQGDRPTCVAFAITSLHEHWREIVCKNKTQIQLDLAPEFLFYGCKQRDGLSSGSNGTTIEAARATLRLDGQCTEDLHSYQAKSNLLAAPSPTARADAATRKLNSLGSQSTTLATVANFIGRGLPLVAVIDIFRKAYTPGPGGILPMPIAGELRLGLHAVLIVDVEGAMPTSTTVFLNSWGAGWGDKGFGRLSSDYFSRYCRQLWAI